jgi:hypothetical protein
MNNPTAQRSILKPQERRPPIEQLSIKIEEGTFLTLKLYAEFIRSDITYVVNESLKHLFNRDRAFAEWRKSKPATSNNESKDE